jgi:hypothetical protein
MTEEGRTPTADVRHPEAPEEGPEEDPRPGPLLDPQVSHRLEAEDRKRPIPGGEPDCPQCGVKMVRRVERYPAPHGGGSPFRVRLTCSDDSCGAWTVYDW